MLTEHATRPYVDRLLRAWRRTIAGPPVPAGDQTPEAHLGISPTTLEEGSTVTLSAAGSSGQNALEVTYRLTPPVGMTYDLGPFPYAGGSSADVTLLPAGLGEHLVTLLVHDTVNGLTQTVANGFTVTAGALDVGRVEVLPSSVVGAVGDAPVLEARVWSEPSAGTLAEKRTALLSWLNGLTSRSSKRLLSGQYYEVGVDSYATIYAQTGEYPAMFVTGLDDDPTQGNLGTALQWAINGGLVVLQWWPNNPITGGDVGDRSDMDLTKILSGGSKRAEWLAALDAIAVKLAVFRDAGYPVIFVPFWATNTDWYWYSTNNVSNFVALWADMYAYLMTTKALGDCLLWMFHGFGAWHESTVDDYAPSTSEYQLTGFASQDPNTLATSNASAYAQLVLLGKPIFLAWYEVQAPPAWGPPTGPNQISYAPMITDLKTQLVNVVGFWTSDGGYDGLQKQNGAALVMQDPWTLARDDYAARPGAGAEVLLLGRLVEWSVDAPTVCDVPPYGQEVQLHLLAQGSAQVRAACEGVPSALVPVQVGSAVVPVDHVTIDHSTITGEAGTTHAAAATAYDAADNPLAPSRITGWNTDNDAVAYHSGTDGLIHLVGVGVAHIQAWGDYAIGSNVLTVTVTSNVAVGSVIVAPAGPLNVETGYATNFQATVWSGPNGTGTQLPGRLVSWTSSNHAVAADPPAGYTTAADWLTAGDTSIQAHCEGVNSNSVTAHATVPPPPSGTYPNKPAGLSTLFEYAGTIMPPNSWGWNSEGMISGMMGWWGSPGNQYIVSVGDDTAWMQSPVKALRYVQGWGPPAPGELGQEGGASNGIVQWWRSSSESDQVDTLYFAWRVRMFGDGVDFDMHPVNGTKMFYLMYGPLGAPNVGGVVSLGMMGSRLQTRGQWCFWVHECRDDGSRRAIICHYPNVPGGYGVVPVGVHGGGLLECLFTMNTLGSTPANTPLNGKVKMWWNGRLFMWMGPESPYDRQPQYPPNPGDPYGRGLRYRCPNDPSGFRGIHYAPVWGGGGGVFKLQTDFLDVDHAYGAGA